MTIDGRKWSSSYWGFEFFTGLHVQSSVYSSATKRGEKIAARGLAKLRRGDSEMLDTDQQFDRVTVLGFRLAIVECGGEQHMRIQRGLHDLKRTVGSKQTNKRRFRE